MEPLRLALEKARHEQFLAKDEVKYNKIVAELLKVTNNQQIMTLQKAAGQIDLSQENYTLSLTKYIKDPVVSKVLMDNDKEIAKAFRARRNTVEISEEIAVEAWKKYLGSMGLVK